MLGTVGRGSLGKVEVEVAVEIVMLVDVVAGVHEGGIGEATVEAVVVSEDVAHVEGGAREEDVVVVGVGVPVTAVGIWSGESVSINNLSLGITARSFPT